VSRSSRNGAHIGALIEQQGAAHCPLPSAAHLHTSLNYEAPLREWNPRAPLFPWNARICSPSPQILSQAPDW